MAQLLPSTADIVIVGAGVAGMAAAITATQEGLRPLLLEKSGVVGGTAAYAVGAIWIPNNHLMQASGFPDDTQSVNAYFAATVGELAREEIQQAYIKRGREAVVYMERYSELRVVPLPYPDYLTEYEGARLGGRYLHPLEYDGRLLGDALKTLRAPLPQFSILKSLMMDEEDMQHFLHPISSIRSTAHVAKRLARYAKDRLRHPRSTRLLFGNALVARLYKSLLDRRVPIVLNASAERLLCGKRRVAHIDVRVDGQLHRVSTPNVVLSAGGFSHDEELMRRYSRAPVGRWSLAAEGATGDGIRMALSAGAELDRRNVDTAFYSPVSIVPQAGGGSTLWPHFVFDRAKPGLIAVNGAGDRFVNEASSYHAFGKAMFDAGALPAYLICDRDFIRRYGLGIVRPGGALRAFKQSGYLIEGSSLDALAGKLSIDPHRLRASVEVNNRAAVVGHDEAFGKGSTDYNRFLGDPRHDPNPCLGPIEVAPFYAVKVHPGNIGSSLGIRTNSNAQVLGGEGEPIGGLYACGNDMNSPTGGNYIGPGITIGPAITFGYVAARHAASEHAIEADRPASAGERPLPLAPAFDEGRR